MKYAKKAVKCRKYRDLTELFTLLILCLFHIFFAGSTQIPHGSKPNFVIIIRGRHPYFSEAKGAFFSLREDDGLTDVLHGNETIHPYFAKAKGVLLAEYVSCPECSSRHSNDEKHPYFSFSKGAFTGS